LKRIIITLFACIATLATKAQIGYNYYQFDFGLSGAINTPHTDFHTATSSNAVLAHFTYNYTPFINYIAEVQLGSLNGADSTIVSGSNTTFNNNYSIVSFRAQVQAGEFIDYSRSQFINALKNIYISSGIGVIYNDAKVSVDGSLASEANASTAFIPVKIGYEFKVLNSYNEPYIKFDVGYQHNFVLADTIDGYASGNNNDAFGQFVIGIKVAVGGSTSYRKAINY